MCSTSIVVSTTTSRSGTASTSALAPHSLASRAASRSTKCSGGFPTGRSTPTTPSSTPRSYAGGAASRPCSAERDGSARREQVGAAEQLGGVAPEDALAHVVRLRAQGAFDRVADLVAHEAARV